MPLTKNDIIDKVKARLKFSRQQSIELIEMLIERIKISLESGSDVLVLILAIPKKHWSRMWIW